MNQNDLSGRWDATEYFKQLAEQNKLCAAEHFKFCIVSGLQGFQDAVNSLTEHSNFICVSDTSDGVMETQPTPHIRQVKTIFLAMRHDYQSADWPDYREECLATMREVFRQLMSRFLKEKTFIEQGGIIIEPNIQFSEIDRYFLSGCACAYFQIVVNQWSNLEFQPDQWQ